MSRRKKTNEIHPAVEQHKQLRKERMCLKCDQPFASKCPGNRICGKCKRLMIDVDLPATYRTQLREDLEE
jgi:hypothetical protein